MQVKTHKLSNTQAELNISNTAEEVEGAYQAAFKTAQKEIRLPGFRSGKAPIDLVERHLGKAALEKAAKYLLLENLEKCIDSLEPKAGAMPQIKIKEFERSKGAVFTGVYDLQPCVHLAQLKKLEVEVDTPIVDKDFLEKRIEEIRKEKAFLCEREGGVLMHDHAELDITICKSDVKSNETDENDKNEEKPIYQKNNLRIVLGNKQLLPGIDEEIINMKINEEKVFSINVGEDFIDKAFAGKELSVCVKLLGCWYEDLPLVDNEFAKDQGEYENLSEFMNDMREKLRKQGVHIIHAQSRETLLKNVIDESEIILPDSLVETEYDHRIEQIYNKFQKKFGKKEIGKEEILHLLGYSPEKLRSECEAGLKRYLTISKLQESLGLKVTAEEVQELWDALHSRDPNVKALSADEDEKLKMHMKQKIEEEKVMEYLYSKAKISQGKGITLTEMQKNGLLGH